LEEAVKEVVLSAPLEDWPTRRKRLIDFGLRGEVVDLHVQDIRSYANHIVQKSKSMPRPIPKQGNLPPSPESESSPPRYTTDPVSQLYNPLEVCLLTRMFSRTNSRTPFFCSFRDWTIQ
jgi:hypothetical protein